MTRKAMPGCTKCGLALPLSYPLAGEACMRWVCTGCGAAYDAVLDSDRVAELLPNVRPAKLDLCPERLANMPAAADAFLARLRAEKSYAGPERRGGSRHRVVAPVAVMPLGAAFQPAGDAFLATTINVSQSGLAMLSTRAVQTRAILVDLLRYDAEGLQVIVHPARCRLCRRFYEIAGPFMLKTVESTC